MTPEHFLLRKTLLKIIIGQISLIKGLQIDLQTEWTSDDLTYSLLPEFIRKHGSTLNYFGYINKPIKSPTDLAHKVLESCNMPIEKAISNQRKVFRFNLEDIRADIIEQSQKNFLMTKGLAYQATVTPTDWSIYNRPAYIWRVFSKKNNLVDFGYGEDKEEATEKVKVKYENILDRIKTI